MLKSNSTIKTNNSASFIYTHCCQIFQNKTSSSPHVFRNELMTSFSNLILVRRFCWKIISYHYSLHPWEYFTQFFFVPMCTHSMEFDSFYRAEIYRRPCRIILNGGNCSLGSYFWRKLYLPCISPCKINKKATPSLRMNWPKFEKGRQRRPRPAGRLGNFYRVSPFMKNDSNF